jgi:hypothetical protein
MAYIGEIFKHQGFYIAGKSSNYGWWIFQPFIAGGYAWAVVVPHLPGEGC